MAIVALNVVMAVREEGVLKPIYAPAPAESPATDALDEPPAAAAPAVIAG